MEHSEAVQQMVAERYLLNELPPDLRDAFEEHMFDCPECAFDIRAGAAFVDEAKVQLPGFTKSDEVPARAETVRPTPIQAKARWWQTIFATPAFAAPVFAALLLFIGYQNLVTYPALRTAANEPRLLPSVSLHAATRAGTHQVIEADRKLGASALVEIPEQSAYTSYAVDLYDPQGKLAWTRNLSAAAIGAEGDALSLSLPGAGLQQGSYTLAISGTTPAEQRTEIERYIFDIHFNN